MIAGWFTVFVFSTRRVCCDHLVVIKMNNTFQSALINYSCWLLIWFFVLIYCIKIMVIVKVIHLCRCTAIKIIKINH